MIDIWQANIQVAIAFGVMLVVIILLYIAFFKDPIARGTLQGKRT